MFAAGIGRLLRARWLALMCLLGPMTLGFGALGAAALLLPQQAASDVKLTYKFLPAEAAQTGAITQGMAQGKGQKTEAAPVDAAILLPARDIHGRMLYAVASGFLYLASGFALAFGFWVVLVRNGAKIAALAAVAFALIAYAIVMRPTAIEQLRPLVVERILEAAPNAQPPIDLLSTNGSRFETLLLRMFPNGGSGLGATVLALVRLNTTIGLASVGMLLSALASVSVPRRGVQRSRDKAHRDLRDRLTAIHIVLGLGAALLVIAVAASKLLIQWPVSLLIEPQRTAIEPLANALNQLFGATCTLALLAAVAPALFAFALDRRKFYQIWPEALPAGKTAASEIGSEERTRSTASKAVDDLGLATVASIGSVVGVLAPLMTPHVMELLSGVVEVFSHAGVRSAVGAG